MLNNRTVGADKPHKHWSYPLSKAALSLGALQSVILSDGQTQAPGLTWWQVQIGRNGKIGYFHPPRRMDPARTPSDPENPRRFAHMENALLII